MFSFRSSVCFLVLVLFLAGSVSFGQTKTAWLEQPKLTASDGASSDQLGMSVAIYGQYAVVGAPYDDDMGSNSGSAYVFGRTGSNWLEEDKLTASDGASPDLLGGVCALGGVGSGTFAVVGAEGHSAGRGAVYVYKRGGPTSWPEQTKLIASDAADADHFGVSISMSNIGHIVVGAIHDDDNGSGSGSVYTFIYELDNWWPQRSKRIASDGVTKDWFGTSLDVSGDGGYLIVGAPGDDDKGSNSGSVYIYTRSGYNWISEVKLYAPDPASSDTFGRSVAIDDSGTYVVIGASGHDESGESSGAAYVFKRIGSNWVSWAKLTAPDADAYAYFGDSVDIGSGYIIVSAYGDDETSGYSGAAYIFALNGSTWSQQAKLTASDAFSQDFFGYSAAIDPAEAEYGIVGSYYDDPSGSNSGSAYIFKRSLCPVFDLDGDCLVDLQDFCLFADQWLQSGS